VDERIFGTIGAGLFMANDTGLEQDNSPATRCIVMKSQRVAG
jgi:hypothetical protein